MMVLGLIGAWCLLPLPLAVAVGRALAVGAGPDGAPAAPITADDPIAAL
jgi:hypothetical protein